MQMRSAVAVLLCFRAAEAGAGVSDGCIAACLVACAPRVPGDATSWFTAAAATGCNHVSISEIVKLPPRPSVWPGPT